MKEIINLPLGQKVTYKCKYDSNLLVGIPRKLSRDTINLPNTLPFKGFDVWNCYEVSWLNNKGKPCVKILQFIVPAESEYLIESKSVKLYLNSFNGTKFGRDQEVQKIIQTDFSNVARSEVMVRMHDLKDLCAEPIHSFDGLNIDGLDIEITDYDVNASLLKTLNVDDVVVETLYSNLLKSNCLVTNQPDWASVQIKYRGKQIEHKSLLRYIISFRNHNEFHEQCVEHMFNDIMQQCAPEELTIHAKYTRRGGIDINPYRTNLSLDVTNISKTRDIRQ
ncbi:MAG: NADPH-dependent 7-cyano-7-deazaguanine reductase QueF [Rickettsiaceae bacterium]|nr:NADPH-dependent 7-cyano-7-deazaguanine reductase QueF [Rickettsiaceae bacterium]MDP4832719.1 NADPH-dependent 7-cyano-7-deazaguanine reductase QueF [Rickettsiaceae bacterium]MDP5021143.1 NADPH-dependent 7-cyano-7-deazaguanine reductase QueF [Rickettsiaceae bacterium]